MEIELEPKLLDSVRDALVTFVANNKSKIYPRGRYLEITLKNFKSFVGKKFKIPLYTTDYYVGNNGSGKSTLLQAIQWGLTSNSVVANKYLSNKDLVSRVEVSGTIYFEYDLVYNFNRSFSPLKGSIVEPFFDSCFMFDGFLYNNVKNSEVQEYILSVIPLELKGVMEIVKSNKRKYTAIKSERDALESSIKSLLDSAIDISSIKSEIETLESQLKSEEKVLETLKKDIASLTYRKGNLDAKIQSNVVGINSISGKNICPLCNNPINHSYIVDSLSNGLITLRAEKESVEEAISQATDSISRIGTAINTLSYGINTKKVQVAKYDTIEPFRIKLETLNKELIDLDTIVTSLQKAYNIELQNVIEKLLYKVSGLVSKSLGKEFTIEFIEGTVVTNPYSFKNFSTGEKRIINILFTLACLEMKQVPFVFIDNLDGIDTNSILPFIDLIKYNFSMPVIIFDSNIIETEKYFIGLCNNE